MRPIFISAHVRVCACVRERFCVCLVSLSCMKTCVCTDTLQRKCNLERMVTGRRDHKEKKTKEEEFRGDGQKENDSKGQKDRSRGELTTVHSLVFLLLYWTS